MSDYSFMKSGFNNLITEDNNQEENILALVSTFMVNSLKSCNIYVSHCKRNGITQEDIRRSLMLEVFLYTKRNNIIEEIENMKEILKSDVDDEEDLNEIIMDDDEIDEFKESDCECALCKCINTIYDRWNSWEPVTPLEISLKTHFSNQ